MPKAGIQAQKNPDRNKGRGGLEDARHPLAACFTWPQSGPNHHVVAAEYSQPWSGVNTGSALHRRTLNQDHQCSDQADLGGKFLWRLPPFCFDRV
jgi:hypothetical protein